MTPLDIPTAEVRLLDAAEGCRSWVAEARGLIQGIDGRMERMEADMRAAGDVARSIQPMVALLGALTWRAGLLVIVAALAPSILSMLGFLLLLGRGAEVVALIPGQ